MEIFKPEFQAAVDQGVRLVVDLDGVAGYATAFLQGLFGPLANEFGSKTVRDTVIVVSDDNPYLLDYIEQYIEEAKVVKNDRLSYPRLLLNLGL